MLNPFSPRLNCERGSLVTSSAVVLSDVPVSSFARILGTDNPGTILKNGADVGQVTTILSGDSIQIQTTAAPNFATPLFVAFEIAGEPGAWSVVTKPSDVKVKYSGYAGIIDQSLVEAESLVSDYGPDVTFVRSKYSKAGDFLDQGPVNAVAASLHASIIPDYYSSSVIQLDQDDNAIGRIVIGAQPWAVTVAAAISWVTVTRLNAVYGIDNTGKIVAVLACGARPLGIASYKRSDGKWVVSCVCRGDSSIHSWVLSASGAVESHSGSTLPTASPLDIAYRSGGDLLISTVSNLLAAPAGSSIAAYSGGAHKRLRYCAANDTIYAHLSGVSNPSIIGWAGMYGPGLNIPIDTDVCDFAVSATGEIATVRFTTGAIGYYKNNVKVRQFQVDPYPYAVRFAADGTLAVENMYGPPSIAPDQIPDQFDLQPRESVPQRTAIDVAPWTVFGLDAATTVAVPNIYEAKLKKNGVAVGNKTTVVSGDVLALSFVTPRVEGELIDLPVFVGPIGTSYKTVTSAEDVVPDLETFVFPDALDLALSAVTRSSTFTLAGIDPAVTLPFSISAGKLFVNSVLQTGLTATLKAGDYIYIEIAGPSSRNQKLSVEVLLDRWATTWNLFSKIVPVYWIKDSLRGVGQFDVPFTPTISAILVRATLNGDWAAETDLHAPPNGSNVRNNPYLFIPSFYEGCLYRVSGAGEVAERIDYEPTSRPFALTVSPRTSTSTEDLSRRFLTMAGANTVVEVGSANPPIVMPGSPRGISGRADGSRVYVAIPELGQIVILKPTSGAGPYVIEKVVTVGGQPYDVITWGAQLIFSDRETNVLRVLSATDVVLPTTYTVGYGVWDMEIVQGVLYTANSYDNTVSMVYLSAGGGVGTVQVGSVPNGIIVNTASRQVFVSHYGQNDLIEIVEGMPRAPHDIHRPLSAAAYNQNGIFGVSLYSNLAQGAGNPDILVVETPMDPLVWPTFEDAEKGTTVRSATAVVSGVIRTVQLTWPASDRYIVYVNDVAAQGQQIVKNGDRIYIDVHVPLGTYTDIVISISSFNVTSTFRVEPERIRVMEPVTFEPQIDVALRQELVSSSVTVKGLTPDTFSPVYVSTPHDVEWSIVLNGVRQPNEPTVLPNGIRVAPVTLVKNGDVLALYGISRGQYNSVIDYVLISGSEPVGAFNVSNKKLDGIEPNHYVKLEVGPAITADAWLALRAISMEVIDAATGLVIGGSGIALSLASTPLAVGASKQLLAQAPLGVRYATATPRLGTASTAQVFRSSALGFGPEKPARIDTSSFRPMVDELGVDVRISSVQLLGPERFYSQYLSHPPVNSDKELTFDVYRKPAPSTSLARAFVTRSGHGVLLSPVMEFKPFPHQVIKSAVVRFVTKTTSVQPEVAQTAAIFRTPTPLAIILRAVARPSKVPQSFSQSFVSYARKLVGHDAPIMFVTNQVSQRSGVFEASAVTRPTSVLPTFQTPPTKRQPQVPKLILQEFVVMAPLSIRVLVRQAPVLLNRNLVGMVAANGERAALRDHRYNAADSASQQGVFTSSALALEFAAGLGYPNAVAIPVNGTPFYTWATPSPRQNADCGIVASKFPIPHKWYVHGG